MQTTRRSVLGLGVAGLGLSLAPRLARAADTASATSTASSSASNGVGESALAACDRPPLGRIAYDVVRKGDRLGEHVATFRADGADFIARNDIEIVARVLGIPVYRYEHTNEEIWRDGKLQAVTSSTNKNGKKIELAGERKGDGKLHLTGKKGELALEGPVLTTSLWHPHTPAADRLLDIEDGFMKSVTGRYEAKEEVPLPDGSTRARHYRLSGGFERDVWYDDACRLLRVAFETKRDGSLIVLEPKAVET
jgi:hypothetical protein